MPRKSKTVVELENRLAAAEHYNMLLRKLVAALMQDKARFLCAAYDDIGDRYELYAFPNNPRHNTWALALLTEDGEPTRWIADVLDEQFRWPQWVEHEVGYYRMLIIREWSRLAR